MAGRGQGGGEKFSGPGGTIWRGISFSARDAMNYTLRIRSLLQFLLLAWTAFAALGPVAHAAIVAKPTIYAFNVAGETTVNLGTTVTLNWSVSYGATVSISPDVGVVTGTEISLTPTKTTTYTLTATNVAGSVSKTKTVTVVAPPAFQSLTATPNSVTAGSSAKLSWSAPGAAYFTVSTDVGPDVGNVFANSVTVRPATTTTYTVVAVNTAGTDVRTIVVPVVAKNPKPVISAFGASPASVVAGSPAMLTWSVSGATSLSIAPGVGAVSGTSVTVTPATTTTYTLTATNAGGTVTGTTTVTVTVPAPVIATFAANPNAITLGGATTLNWSVAGATSLSISPDVGPVTGNSLTVSPAATTTYTLTATNSGGTVTQTALVTVASPAPTIPAFTANPPTIPLGASTTLAWSVSGATEISIAASAGASPGVVTGTSYTLSPTVNTTYTLTAKNSVGSVSRTAAVTVKPPAPTIGSFTATPSTINAGQTSALSWSVNGATSLSIVADVGNGPGAVTGTSVNVSPTATTNYTLIASNDSGSVSASAKVAVNDPAPVIRSFASIPNTINSGDSATIIWSVEGAATLTVTASTGPSPGALHGASGSITVSPVVSTDYTLTATSPGGVVSHSLTEIVVKAAPPPPVPVISGFGANPATIARGSSTTLSWSVTGADSISIAADVGGSPGAVTGTSVNVSPTDTTTYTLTATNSFGAVTKTATVTVTGPTAPNIGSFTASPSFIQAGGSSLLSWSVSGADSVSISPAIGAVTGTSMTVSPTATTTYTLSATNSIGTNTAMAVVTIFTQGTGAVGHPRIWVTQDTLPALTVRAQNNDAAWLRLRSDCDAYATMRVAFPDAAPSSGTINGGYEYNDYLTPAEELGLGYLVARTIDPVRAARYAAKERELVLALSDPVHHGVPSTDSGYGIRGYVQAMAIGYDWVFDVLNDADRAQVYTEINRWVQYYDGNGFGRDFPQGNYFAGYYAAKALGALATEGENPQGPAMWNDWLNRLHYGMVQPYYAQWLSGGGAPDGWNYGQLETINMIRPIAAAFTAKGLDLIHDAAKPFAYPDGHAKWITQFTWPDLNSVSDRGFVYDNDNPSWTDAGWATQYGGLLRLANGNNAPIMQRYTLDVRAQVGTGAVDPWVEFLFFETGAASASYRTDLSYRTLGDGQVAMRSSWASDAVWAGFQAGPYTGFQDSSEEFFDEGGLAIQRGGVQFVVNGWGALMRNTPGTTDSGNGLFTIAYDELFDTQTDGVYHGRRLFNTYYAVRAGGYWGQDNAGPGETTTTLARFEEGGDYVLMRGANLEQMYLTGDPITGWNRTVVYLRPQLFVVYDRTSLNSASVDNWMAWHVSAAPAEIAAAAPGTHSFDVADARPAFGGNLYRGRVTTVLPANNAVTPVDVFGRGKVYRLEVRQAAPAAASNTWLTVLDASSSATQAGSAIPLTAAAGNLSTAAAEGTLVRNATGNSAVLFSRSGGAIAGSIVLTLPADHTYLLVTDLVPNTGYAVTATVANGQMQVQIAPGGSLVTTAQGTLAATFAADGTLNAH